MRCTHMPGMGGLGFESGEDERKRWEKTAANDIECIKQIASIVPLDRDVAAYYRDLFIHRLGTISTDATFLMLLNGGDPDVSAKAAWHSMETTSKYYKKVSCEEAQEYYAKHHPAFLEGWYGVIDIVNSYPFSSLFSQILQTIPSLFISFSDCFMTGMYKRTSFLIT